MSNPVLIELTRSHLVESVHTGAIAVARPSGELVLEIGDVRRPVFPRSAIKAFQCLPLIETGAADRLGFGAGEIALACASHSGTERHVGVVRAMLDRVGFGPEALGCGAHDPVHEPSAKALARCGEPATALHNNCSGKHAGMLCTARLMGEPADGYLALSHPVQQRILATFEAFTDHRIGHDRIGIDGCSAPNFATPLADLARAFACFITGEGAAAGRRAACERIAESCWTEPELVAGPGRLDTLLMSRLPGRVLVKTGAEGVYCGALPGLGLGIALKIDDGARRASEAALVHLLDRLVPGARTAAGGDSTICNWQGAVVGETRAAPALSRALDSMVAR
jgi:L-asparaginase II